MPARSVRLVLAVFCAASTLVACQSAEITTTPAPTFTCTPEAGGNSFACSQFQYDEMRAKDALYAEAEQVYRTFLAEDIRIMRAGGVTEPTPVLLETTTGAFLEDVMSDYRAAIERQTTTGEGERVLVSADRVPGVAKGGSAVSLAVCVDSTRVRFFVKGKYVGNGLVNRDQLFFGLIDGRLKIIGADGEEVQSCD